MVEEKQCWDCGHPMDSSAENVVMEMVRLQRIGWWVTRKCVDLEVEREAWERKNREVWERRGGRVRGVVEVGLCVCGKCKGEGGMMRKEKEIVEEGKMDHGE